MSKKKKVSHTNNDNNKNHFQLRKINPLTENQRRTFDAYHENQNLILHGYAGTGKSYISLYLALEEVLSGHSICDKIVVIRSVVPSRDMGFLPGSVKDKAKVYEEPYKCIVDELFGRGDGYDVLKLKNIIQFETTSFLRGRTFYNSIISVDEMQNLSWGELDTIMTRVGDNSRIIFCGDFRQTDLVHDRDKQGIVKFMGITKRMNRFDYIEFNRDDIVRSSLVKDYIITRTEYEDGGDVHTHTRI